VLRTAVGALPSGTRSGTAVGRAAAWLQQQRAPDGHWSGLLDGGAFATALCALRRNRHRRLTQKERTDLIRFLLSRRRSDGVWPLYPDGPADTDTTLLAYLALRFLGMPSGHPAVAGTRQELRARGAARSAGYLARWVLHHVDPRMRPAPRRVPVWPARLPEWFPLSLPGVQPRMAALYDALLLIQRFPVAPRPWEREAAEAVGAELGWGEAGPPARPRGARSLPGWARAALRRLLEAQGPDGSWGGWGPETVGALGALEAAGLPDAHPAVARGLAALVRFDRRMPEGLMSQPCTSSVWDTAWSLLALAGWSGFDPTPSAAWLQAQRLPLPGGGSAWAFEEGNRRVPDADDTALVLGLGEVRRRARRPVADGAAMRWLLRGQNWHGGWPSFRAHPVPLGRLLRPMGLVDIDYGCEDITARAVWSLARQAHRPAAARRAVQRAVRWLRGRQRRDGSWLAWWSIHYLTGTAWVLWGLSAAGCDPRLPWLRRGVRFLLERQRLDGGWGESCSSAQRGAYVPLERSTPSQTAVCLLGLIAHLPPEHAAVRRAVRFLLGSQQAEGAWQDDYPNGVLLIGRYYARFELQPTYLALMALRAASEPAYRAWLLARPGGAFQR